MADKQNNKHSSKASGGAVRKGLVVSTGGGEPIKKGGKWTDEQRDLDQPRDEEGHFTYNAAIGKGRKYAYHGVGTKGGEAQEPPQVRGVSEDVRTNGYKKGDKVKMGEGEYVITKDISFDEFKKLLTEYSGGDFESEYGTKADMEKRGAVVKEAGKGGEYIGTGGSLEDVAMAKRGFKSGKFGESGEFEKLGNIESNPKISPKTMAAILEHGGKYIADVQANAKGSKGAVATHYQKAKPSVAGPVASNPAPVSEPVSEPKAEEPAKETASAPAQPSASVKSKHEFVNPDGSINPSKVDVSDPATIAAFDKLAKYVNSHPEKFGLKPGVTVNGKQLAFGAKKGNFKDKKIFKK